LLKFDIYLQKERFFGVWKILEMQNQPFVASSQQPLILIDAKHMEIQQIARILSAAFRAHSEEQPIPP
jgi:hypothetical protein